MSEFLQSVFEDSDPRRARGETITAREILERGERFRHADDEAFRRWLESTARSGEFEVAEYGNVPPDSAEAAGVSYERLVQRIVNLGLRRSRG